jgi:hypothetical protein
MPVWRSPSISCVFDWPFSSVIRDSTENRGRQRLRDFRPFLKSFESLQYSVFYFAFLFIT